MDTLFVYDTDQDEDGYDWFGIHQEIDEALAALDLEFVLVETAKARWNNVPGYKYFGRFPNGGEIARAMALNGPFRLELKVDNDYDPPQYSIIRYSHDEQTGARFDIVDASPWVDDNWDFDDGAYRQEKW